MPILSMNAEMSGRFPESMTAESVFLAHADFAAIYKEGTSHQWDPHAETK